MSAPMHIVRTIAHSQASLYLTFDDGPDPASTPRVLDALACAQVHATFFVVVERAAKHPELLNRIADAGHAIGNHSLNHRYGPFFQGKAKMLRWVSCAEERLADLVGNTSVGFRPPAGVCTPELFWALRQLEVPLVLWKIRFFDAIVKWTPKRALRSLPKTAPGAIVLLHDAQRPERVASFNQTLANYIDSLRERGFTMRALNRDLCLNAARVPAQPRA